MNRIVTTSILAGLALSAIVLAGAAHARDLSNEFRGVTPSEFGRSFAETAQDFRTGFNPAAPRSIEDILSGRNDFGRAKPDSFRTGVDLESN